MVFWIGTYLGHRYLLRTLLFRYLPLVGRYRTTGGKVIPAVYCLAYEFSEETEEMREEASDSIGGALS